MTEKSPENDQDFPWLTGGLSSDTYDPSKIVRIEEQSSPSKHLARSEEPPAPKPDDFRDTDPIPVQRQRIQEPAPETIPIYEPPVTGIPHIELSDLTKQELRELAIRDLYDRTIQQRHKGDPPERPADFKTRRYLWWMLWRELIVAGAIILTLLIAALVDQSFISKPNWIPWIFIGLFGLEVWFIAHFYVDWRTWSIFSDDQQTGVMRKANWLLGLRGINKRLPTHRIETKEETRGQIANAFDLNCWRVTLDAPGQQDSTYLKDVRMVRSGDVLTRTVAGFQEYREYYL